jgi:hypothetical protein
MKRCVRAMVAECGGFVADLAHQTLAVGKYGAHRGLIAHFPGS